MTPIRFADPHEAAGTEPSHSIIFPGSDPYKPSQATLGSPCLFTGTRRRRGLGLLYSLAFILTLCCSEWPWTSGVAPGAPRPSSASWGAHASSGFEGRFLGRQITTDALRMSSPRPRSPEKHLSSDDDLLEDEEPLEIWGDLDDSR